jgi:hypothetical protein
MRVTVMNEWKKDDGWGPTNMDILIFPRRHVRL